MTAYYGEVFYTVADRVTPYLRFERFQSSYNSFLLDSVDHKRTSELTWGFAYHLKLWEALVKLEVRNHWDKDTPAGHSTQYYNIYGASLAIGF